MLPHAWRLVRLLILVAFYIAFVLVTAGTVSKIEKDQAALRHDTDTAKKWNLASGIYFTTSLFLTIGYGDFIPVTSSGVFATVFAGCIGIPLNFAIWVHLSGVARSATKFAETRLAKGNGRARLLYRSILLATTISAIVTFFIVTPAAVFYRLSGRPVQECLWLTFISITTVGFGDIVPAQLLTHKDESTSTSQDYAAKIGRNPMGVVILSIWLHLGVASWSVLFGVILHFTKSPLGTLRDTSRHGQDATSMEWPQGLMPAENPQGGRCRKRKQVEALGAFAVAFERQRASNAEIISGETHRARLALAVDYDERKLDPQRKRQNFDLVITPPSAIVSHEYNQHRSSSPSIMDESTNTSGISTPPSSHR